MLSPELFFSIAKANARSQLRESTLPRQRLNLIVAAVILWNTVYLERAIAALREHGITIEDEALALLSPIGWNM